MGKKERVILIKGDASQWYEQAIFIVNQDTPQENIPKNFVAEAEKIIHNHVRNKYSGGYTGSKVGIAYASASTAMPAQSSRAKQKAKAAKRKRSDYILNTILCLGCIFIAAVLMWGLIG